MIVDYYQKGDSLEGAKAKVFAKKIVAGALIQDPQLGRVRKFACERDGEAVIEKELSPKKPVKKDTSALNLGDRLICKKFYILTRDMRLKFKKSAFSGDHNTNLGFPEDVTFAEISYPFHSIVSKFATIKLSR